MLKNRFKNPAVGSLKSWMLQRCDSHLFEIEPFELHFYSLVLSLLNFFYFNLLSCF